ncbi:hypothetical protein [Mesorhizobium sp. URHB0026]
MNAEPRDCEACGGSGEVVFGIWVYEHGCGFGHESSDARPCEECHGTGLLKPPAITTNRTTQDRIPDDDLPF